MNINGSVQAERPEAAEPFDKTDPSDVSDTLMKLDRISETIKNTDYSGMTSAEIYADIERKYSDAFDDFYITMVFWTCRDHIMIRNHFLNEADRNAGKVTLGLINEARGYSDMSYDMIEAEIKEKYIGRTGFIDRLNLFGELFFYGVLPYKYGAENAVNMAMKLGFSVECGGDAKISRKEWISRVKETKAMSPFALLLDSPCFCRERNVFSSMADDIIFGTADK